MEKATNARDFFLRNTVFVHSKTRRILLVSAPVSVLRVAVESKPKRKYLLILLRLNVHRIAEDLTFQKARPTSNMNREKHPQIERCYFF